MNLAAHELRTLIVAPLGRDAAALAETLQQNGLEALVCAHLSTCSCKQVEGTGCLLITEEALGTPAAGALIAMLDAQPPWSALPIVVLTTGDTNHRVDLLERLGLSMGVVTLLARPLRQAALVGAIRVALNARCRQYEIRKLLEDRNQTEQVLRDADRRKDEFLATLAHELRNPLAAIRSALEVLKLKHSQDDALISCRDIIDRQVADLTHLVDDLLEISRISRGKLVLRDDLVELRHVVGRALEATRPLIDASHHTLEVNLPAGEHWLRGDAARLVQVFTNLLNNAARYTATGGHISVEAVAENGELRITISDTGTGIAAEHLAGIFEMFSQVSPALERSGNGLGVGLALARTLVNLHGGSVTAHSSGVGHGAEFVVRLPEVDAPAAATAADNALCEKTAPLHILVVDDNRDAADALVMLLDLMGHEVTVAYDSPEALQLMEQLRPQVVLLDIGLPTMNGYQVARQVRAKPWGGDITLIAQTGWGQREDKRRAAEAGFDHHMTKPIDIAMLGELLTQVAAAAHRPGANSAGQVTGTRPHRSG